MKFYPVKRLEEYLVPGVAGFSGLTGIFKCC